MANEWLERSCSGDRKEGTNTQVTLSGVWPPEQRKRARAAVEGLFSLGRQGRHLLAGSQRQRNEPAVHRGWGRRGRERGLLPVFEG